MLDKQKVLCGLAMWMKLLVFGFMITFTGCKNPVEKETLEETEQNVEIQIYSGDLIHTEEATVLAGKNFIYGIAENEKAIALAEKVESIKENEFDIVPVTLKGTLQKKSEASEGWDQILTITQIVRISEKAIKADAEIK